MLRVSYLIVYFDRLDVLPLLDGLRQVHHAEGDLSKRRFFELYDSFFYNSTFPGNLWELVVAHLDLPDLIVLGESVVVEDGEDQRLVEGLAVGDLDFQKQLLFL